MRWLFLGSVCCLAVGIGLVAGLVLGGTSRSTMAVSTQPREDQIVLFAESAHEAFGGGSSTDDPSWTRDTQTPVVMISSARYPVGTSFRFEFLFHRNYN